MIQKHVILHRHLSHTRHTLSDANNLSHAKTTFSQEAKTLRFRRTQTLRLSCKDRPLSHSFSTANSRFTHTHVISLSHSLFSCKKTHSFFRILTQGNPLSIYHIGMYTLFFTPTLTLYLSHAHSLYTCHTLSISLP